MACRFRVPPRSSTVAAFAQAFWCRTSSALLKLGAALLALRQRGRSPPRVGDLAQVGENAAELCHPARAEVSGPFGLHLGHDPARSLHAARSSLRDPHEPRPAVRGVGPALHVTGALDRRCLEVPHGSPEFVELLIIDKADRLGTPALEQLRDRYDRSRLGLILSGMPGIEKRLARYPQLYSRVGFVHRYRPLSADEQASVLARHWPHLGLHDPDDYTTAEALAAITRITSGNFRLTSRLMAQVERVLDINQLRTVTKEVVETARENLVIGTL